MSEKRKREEGGSVPDYRPGKKKLKQKGGFRVGPANLPDGTYKRKNQQIKESLIQKAQIKKGYEKVKKHGAVSEKDLKLPQPASLQTEREHEQSEVEAGEEPSVAPHPDRQILMEKSDADVKEEEAAQSRDVQQRRKRQRKPKPEPFKREHEQALQRKSEAEERRKAREEAERQRQQKIEERERFRKAMAKARQGGPNGQRKLGRESKVLLERVKKMVDGAG